MTSLLTELHEGRNLNPLDSIEDVLREEEWSISRPSDREMLIACPGQWNTYNLHFMWLTDMQAMHVSCALEIKSPKAQKTRLMTLLSEINARLWVGHFEISHDTSSILYRHTLLLRGAKDGASIEQVEDLIDIAVGEADRFYPAFQFLLWAGKSPEEALAASLLETVGEA